MATVNVRPMMLRSVLRQLLQQREDVVRRNPPDLAAYLARSREIEADIERQIAESVRDWAREAEDHGTPIVRASTRGR